MADASGLRQLARARYGGVAQRAAELMKAALQDAAPLGETGETRRQIEVQPSGFGGDTFTFTATAPTKQGQYVEEGTDAHPIVPVRAKALRFMGGGGRISQPAPNQRIATRGGGVVYARRVFMPARPARPWFAPTIQLWPVFLEQALEQA